MQVLLDQLDLADVVVEQLAQDLLRLAAHLRHQLVRLGEPARDQLGRAGRAAPLESVATTISTPSSDRCRRSRRATSDRSPTPRPSTNVTPASTWSTIGARLRGQLDHVAVVGDHDRRRGNARLLREPRVRGEHPELAVDRHHRLRPQEADQRAQLLGACVAGDVDVGVLLVEHLRPAARQPVDRVVDAQLVSRERRARR